MRGKVNNTIETTFGQITVFNNEAASNKPSSRSQRREKNVTKEEKVDESNIELAKHEQASKQQSAAKQTNVESSVNEDFFGFNSSELNYFDQQLVKSYDHPTPKIEASKIEVNRDSNQQKQQFKEPLDYVDDQYFGALDPNNKRQSLTMSPNNVTKSDLEKEFSHEANYIDEQVLGLTTTTTKKPDHVRGEEDMDSVGSVRDLKKGKSSQKRAGNKQVASSVPLVQSTNLTEENVKNARMQFKKLDKDKDDRKQDVESNHKVLAGEVPDWSKMTIDEAVNILKSHVCYHNAEEGLFGLDKPYGLATKRGPGVHLSVASLLPKLEESLNLNCRLLMCNRLDENTTGVMLFAMNSETAAKIRHYYNEKKIVKQYLAITKDIPNPSEGEINIPLIRRSINGKYKTYLSPDYNEIKELISAPPTKDNEKRRYAVTKYRVIDSFEKAALVEVQPQTGFTHQIRSHFAFGLGCPVLGDHKYSHHVRMAPQKLPGEILELLKIRQSKARHVPMHLHAYRIILPEFFDNFNVFIQAKLPIHFLNNLKRLKLKF